MDQANGVEVDGKGNVVLGVNQALGNAGQDVFFFGQSAVQVLIGNSPFGVGNPWPGVRQNTNSPVIGNNVTWTVQGALAALADTGGIASTGHIIWTGTTTPGVVGQLASQNGDLWVNA